MLQLRDYQQAAIDGLYAYLRASKGNPIIVMPTGSGKSFVMAAFIRDAIQQYPDTRILILTHVKELIKQNYLELIGHWPEAPAGIYSAGLNRRDTTSQIIFAGIQSVHSKAEELQGFHLVLIDECHLVPRNSSTMYRKFLDDMYVINENVRIIGLTATHYRLDSGLLIEGDKRIFTDVAYDVPVKTLIDEGYLCALKSKAPNQQLDVTDVHTRGGEFIHSELAAAVDQEDVNDAIVKEIIYYGQGRKSWLIFCTGIAHAEHIRDILRSRNITAETVSGKTNKMERDFILDEFKAGAIQAVTNCDILTTGFNAPQVDLLAMLRPTKSTGLYVQIAGRGMRNAPGKTDCLVLDFAGNIERHGPIDRVKPRGKQDKDGEKCPAPVKICPKCRSVVPIGLMECPDCGHVFPAPESQLDPTATTKNIISKLDPEWAKVKEIYYARHIKSGKPDSLRVEYDIGEKFPIREWVCFEHTGYAQKKARGWWIKMNGERGVMTVTDALNNLKTLKRPSHILIQEDGKYVRVIRHHFDPAEPEPKWWTTKTTDTSPAHDTSWLDKQDADPIADIFNTEEVTDDNLPF